MNYSLQLLVATEKMNLRYFRHTFLILIIFFAGLFMGSVKAAESWVHEAAKPGDFVLVKKGIATPIYYSAEDFKVVDHAAHDLASDVERVTDVKPVVHSNSLGLHGQAILIGTLGKSPLIDTLVASGKLDMTALHGAWESFLIATVDAPLPGVSRALVIVGSDRRGTAFGIYELSQALGVSPWYWWADVAPEKKSALFVVGGTRRFGPPSVKYRGIFLNDEDWGLQPWAAKTFEPENGGIGPKTYAKVFELLLRLKANTIWPAMHPGTKPFNSFPQNARVADDYAIVMGSSHAEPMLRNNVSEWKAPPETYNYLTNREGVLKYWDERAMANGSFENIYTVGMRGIHDSSMQGPKTDAERIGVLQQIFKDQRALIAQHAHLPAEQIPQMFCAYKEVLGLYRQGLPIPDDVTIVWPDDNFGYVRNFANTEERKRSGGFGVYYHLSYLGAPLSYLWLGTTPPALIWEEMSKSYDAGARTMWIANVGDLKPAEIGTEFFLQMAWDIHRWQRTNLPDFLTEWAGREFGAAKAHDIGAIMGDYYRLNYQRKPEHLQWWLPKEAPRLSVLNEQEAAERLNAFVQLRQRAGQLRPTIMAGKRDAFFELVGYPVSAAALANMRFLEGERGNMAAAKAVDIQLTEETKAWNTWLANGKWRHIMSLEPADQQWRSMRIAQWKPPESNKSTLPSAPSMAPSMTTSTQGEGISLEAEHYTRKLDKLGSAWEIIPGLGRTGEGSVAIFPTSGPSVAIDQIAINAPRLDYDISFTAAGEFSVLTYLIPTHPLLGGVLRFAIAFDDAPPQLVALNVKDGGSEWAQGVLNATRIATVTLAVPTPGVHTLHIYGVDAGVVLDKIVLDSGRTIFPPSYFGPPETPATVR